MKRKITGYRLDHENHWVAELECGHGQHVRHDPPWMVREWVTTPEGRATRLGMELNCVRCDELGAQVVHATVDQCRRVLLEAYEETGVSGLCGEGRWEVAVGALTTIDPKTILEKI